MKIRPRDVEGVPARETDKLSKSPSREHTALSGRPDQPSSAATDVKVSVDLAREINALLTQASDDDSSEERKRKVAELKKKYEEGSLKYDSAAVADALLKELF